MKRLSRRTTEQNLLTYFVYVCILNFLLVAGVWFRMQPSSFFQTVKFIGMRMHCPDSTPNLLCIFTTFKPQLYKLKVFYYSVAYNTADSYSLYILFSELAILICATLLGIKNKTSIYICL